MKCDHCQNHARWENDKQEHGCYCYKGFDFAHDANCNHEKNVKCEEYFDNRVKRST